MKKLCLSVGMATSLVALSAMLSGCRAKAPSESATVTVPVATVAPATLENDLVLSAEFRPYQEVDVMAKIAGYVKSIGVDIGDHVKQNAVLATLEVPEVQDDVARAKAGLAAAEAEVVTAEAMVQRARQQS